MRYPPTPTLEKMLSVKDDSHKIGDFLDWLAEQGIHLARYVPGDWPGDDHLVPIGASPDDLLHRYFDIDPNEEERERLAILEAIRMEREQKEHGNGS